MDANGNTLAAGTIGTFQPEPEFRIRRMSPPGGADLSPGQLEELTLYFNSKIGPSILSFVSVMPAPLRDWYFSPDSTWIRTELSVSSPKSTHLITVAAGAQDVNGHGMSRPFTASLGAIPFTARIGNGFDTLQTPLYTYVA